MQRLRPIRSGTWSARGVTSETIVLLGIALKLAFNALLALLQFPTTKQALGAVVVWTMGSLGRATWPGVAVAALVVALALTILPRQAWATTRRRAWASRSGGSGSRR